MRARYQQELNELNIALVKMATAAEKALKKSVKSLLHYDKELANAVIAYDDRIDEMDYDIETMCHRILLRQQPVAGDLRTIHCALKLITDLERIGDQAADIAHIVMNFPDGAYLEKLENIPKLADVAYDMVRKAIKSYISGDVELAKEVVEYDDAADGLFRQIRNDLVAMILQNPTDAEYVIYFMMAAKYFERIGDHATNIAECAVYLVTGKRFKAAATAG